jgi:hypothetical protein
MGVVKEFLLPHLAPLATPYLFVGAGFSRRYGSLPSWPDLLKHFADKTDKSYEFYLSDADGNLPLTATNIAAAFHPVWFSDAEYEESREEWESRVVDKSTPLKIEVAKLLDSLVDGMTVPANLQHEWDLLATATVDGVVTTNYDRILATVFPSYFEYVGQDGLLFSDTQGIAEIYSIHGATPDPTSLVLTARDYEAFEGRNAYLSAKLITIFVEHPVVFLGYSFNDPNVQRILKGIVDGLQNHSVEKLRDRLIFVEWQPTGDPSVESTDINIEGQLLPITRIRTDDWTDLFEALGARKHALPARTLRLLKEQVYDIVRSNDPKERLYAYADIDSAKADDISIVFGVGAKIAAIGITGLQRSDIFDDVLENPPGGLPAEDIINKHIAKLPSNWWYPVHKYLREAGHLDANGEITDPTLVPDRVVKFAKRNADAVVTKVRYRRHSSLASLEEKNDKRWVFAQALELPSYIESARDLREYLVSNASNAEELATSYAKAVVAYDYVHYGLGWD